MGLRTVLLAALPLVAVLPLVPLAAAAANERANRAFTRGAVALFGDHVDAGEGGERNRTRLRAARAGVTLRSFGARALLTGTLTGLGGGLLAAYAVGLAAALVAANEAAVRERVGEVPPAAAALWRLVAGWPTEVHLFGLLAVAGLVGAAVAGVAGHWLRWYLLDQRAESRGSRIEATLPRTVAVVYALSRSGMAFPRVLDTVADDGPLYGEAAVELGVAVRNMRIFGTDVLTALRDLADDTPGDGLGDFSENLAAVLGGGQSISEFLRTQYERYQAAAEAQQERYLELLATFAEAYVTVFVAGPLFMLTTLVVIGLVMQDTLPVIRGLVYGFIPLATLAFAAFVADTTSTLGESRVDAAVDDDASIRSLPSPTEGSDRPARDGSVAGPGAVATDGGATVSARDRDLWRVSRERLAAYDRVSGLRRWVYAPREAVLDQPSVTFLLTVPLGLLWVALRVGTPPSAATDLLRALDGPLAEALLFALVGYGVVYEARRRRIRAIESAVPDFLDRFASVNEAGSTVVGGIHRVAEGDLGALSVELERTREDVRWGADVGTALRRLAARSRSPAMFRSVSLITNAMRASGDVAPVLRLAADEARTTRRLQRERRDEMVTYLMVIYISFLVFLGIVAALAVSFIPAIESAAIPETSGGVAGTPTGGLGGLGSVDTAAYTTVFFHASVVQALCSGLVAGQLGEGSVRDGVKHAAALLALALVTFAFI